jgi:hypothetical protein
MGRVECAKDGLATFWIEVPCGFISQNHTWIIHERSSECHTLLLPDAQLRRSMMEPLAESKSFEHFLGLPFLLNTITTEQAQRYLHVLKSCQVRD